MSSPYALELALSEAVERFVDRPDHQAHRAYIGLRKVAGKYTDDVCVVVCVPEKLPLRALSDADTIPSEIYVQTGGGTGHDQAFSGEVVPVDVQAEPPAAIELLRLAPGVAFAQAVTSHQKCHSPLVSGGAQIQPKGANWVGTLGGMAVSGQVIAITNAHVTGLGRTPNWPMHQPTGGNADYFALVRKVHEIQMGNGGKNLVDLAILDPRDLDGKHTVKPEQIGLGVLGTKAVDAKIGLKVVKSGRTTGVTQGRCVGIKGVSQVGYDAGKVGRFIDQDIFAADEGNFSAAGDSGSFILQAGTNNLVALLFAGGGRQTIGNPARHVLAAAKATLYGG